MSPFAPYCQPLKPGEIYEVDLEIWPMGLALPEGSRLTLAIQGKDFKRAAGPLRDHSATTRPIVRPNFAGTNTLHTDGQYQSYLLLLMLPKQ
jgi:predicted acyl esterase